MSDRVSIALATYNGEQHLEAQLESFLDQSRLPDELVVSDDHSADSTVRLLRSFQQKSPFLVRIYQNPANIGYIRNFEKAIMLCEGDIVFLSDQDDVWLPNKIEEILKEFNRDRTKMVVLNDQIITDDNLEPSGATKLSNLKRLGAPIKSFSTGCCSAHRRGWQKFVLPIPPEAAAHDDWINGVAQELGLAYVHTIPLQLYRRHNNNVSHSLFSSLSGTSKLLSFRSSLRVNRPMRWEHARRITELLLTRIQTHSEHLSLAEAEREARCDALRKRISAYDSRLSIYRRSRLSRLPNVIALLRSGGYRHFGGWKSALRDLLL